MAGAKPSTVDRGMVWRPGAAAAVAAGLLLLSAVSVRFYFATYEKEDWPALVAHVAAEAGEDDLLLFNASWAEIPFSYYHGAAGAMPATRQGLPVPMFESGELEPRMTAQDVGRLRELAAAHEEVWLVYAHESYADPEGLIPDTLRASHTLVGEREFSGPRVLHYMRTAQSE